MPDRTNQEWLRDLAEDAPKRAEALEALRERLKRGLFYYLSRERGDLAAHPAEEIQQMAEDFRPRGAAAHPEQPRLVSRR